MDADRFRLAITNGLGRPILWLRDNPWQPHADAIENVCRHNTAYDPQCEGSRAAYVHEIVALTDAPQHFADLTAAALMGQQETYWDTDHLFRLARLFAEGGHAASRTAIYQKFTRHDAQEPFIGAGEVLALDGMNGLIFVLEQIGDYLEHHPDYWEDDALLQEAEQMLGPHVRAAVQDAATESPPIQRYLDAVNALKLERAASREYAENYRDLPYAQLRKKIIAASGDFARGWLFSWGKDASDDALREAAADLLLETDEKMLPAYLRIFRNRAFPLEHHRLIQLAHSSNSELRTAALRALRHVKDQSVRTFAVDRMMRGHGGGDVVRLLAKNFAPNDERLIESALERPADEDESHWIAHAAVEVFEANLMADAMPSMLAVYERCRCSICRAAAVKVLIGRRNAPSWMLEESLFDSDPHIREMAATAKPSR